MNISVLYTSSIQYKDRISLGRNIRIQSNNNNDVIFCIGKDEEKKIDDEEERPVVNGIGYWFNDDVRNIVHINEIQQLNASFYCLINSKCTKSSVSRLCMFYHNIIITIIYKNVICFFL